MITGWEEFERFFGTVKPIDVRVYGKLSAEAEEWVGQFGVVSKTFEDHVAGFVR
jgi:urocanate hydratase